MLISEIERYLEAVDVFRSEGCEPQWRAEEGLPSEALLHASDSPSASGSSSASSSSASGG